MREGGTGSMYERGKDGEQRSTRDRPKRGRGRGVRRGTVEGECERNFWRTTKRWLDASFFSTRASNAPSCMGQAGRGVRGEGGRGEGGEGRGAEGAGEMATLMYTISSSSLIYTASGSDMSV
jgi:hypothetical protein